MHARRDIFLFMVRLIRCMDINTIINKCIESFAKPNKAAKDLAKAEIGDGLKAVVLGSLVLGIMFSLGLYAGSALVVGFAGMMPFVGDALIQLSMMLGTVAALGVVIVTIVNILISWLLVSLIIWLVAKALGAKGEYTTFAAAWGFPFAVMAALSWIPIINTLAMVYSFYVLYCFLPPTTKLSHDKTVMAIILTIIAMVAIAFLLGYSALALVL